MRVDRKSLIDKCQEATQAQKDVMIQLVEENDAYWKMITMISEAEDEEHEIQRFGKQLQSGVDEERAKLIELGMRWAVEARKRGRGAEQEQRRQEEQRQRRHEEQECVSARKNKLRKRGRRAQTSWRRQEDWQRHKLVEEVQASSEGEMRDVGRTRPGKAKYGGKGAAGSKGRQQVENSVIDEDQGNTGAMRNEEEEENHREDVRTLVEMMQTKGSGAEWRLKWGLVAHTSRPCRSQKQERPER